jgi:hypothetical protein
MQPSHVPSAIAILVGGASVIAGLLLSRRWDGALFGLSSDFWSGFLIGMGIVSTTVGVVVGLTGSGGRPRGR